LQVMMQLGLPASQVVTPFAGIGHGSQSSSEQPNIGAGLMQTPAQRFRPSDGHGGPTGAASEPASAGGAASVSGGAVALGGTDAVELGMDVVVELGMGMPASAPPLPKDSLAS
jgi:hypothetical protein